MLKISCSRHNALEVGKPHDAANFLLNENRGGKVAATGRTECTRAAGKKWEQLVHNKSHVYTEYST